MLIFNTADISNKIETSRELYKITTKTTIFCGIFILFLDVNIQTLKDKGNTVTNKRSPILRRRLKTKLRPKNGKIQNA
jgi:hypothetical protein